MKKLCTTLAIALASLNSFAQTEYLVTVNPTTGTFTNINSLPGVTFITSSPRFSTFDESTHRYLFRGKDTGGSTYLYSVDATTGNIITNPLFPVLADQLDNVAELQFDNSANMLYGLHWDYSEGREYFGSVNTSTGAFTDIDSLPNVHSIAITPNYTTYNKTNHHYTFRGNDRSSITHLYTVNAITGAIVFNPVFPVLTDPFDNITELQYNSLTNTLYGLHWNNSQNKEYLATVNPATGEFTDIDSIPGLHSVTVSPHYTTFDETNHRFIFRGTDNGGNKYLYSVDVTNGNVISSPLFPVLANPSDNLIEFKYDNSSATLYALHWQINLTSVLENEMDNLSFNAYPNPFTNSSKIELDKSYHEITLFIYNLSGQVVSNKTYFNCSSVNVQRENLLNGSYFVSLVCDHLNIGTRKIILQ